MSERREFLKQVGAVPLLPVLGWKPKREQRIVQDLSLDHAHLEKTNIIVLGNLKAHQTTFHKCDFMYLCNEKQEIQFTHDVFAYCKGINRINLNGCEDQTEWLEYIKNNNG